jgi:hypothetical protein
MPDTPRHDPKVPEPGESALRPGGPHGAPVDVGMSELDRGRVPIKDEDLDLPDYDGEPAKEGKKKGS